MSGEKKAFYLVTFGAYSDDHVVGVFESEAEAEEYIKRSHVDGVFASKAEAEGYVKWRWGHLDGPNVSIEEWSVGTTQEEMYGMLSEVDR